MSDGGWVRVAALSDLPVGSRAVVDLDDARALVSHLADGVHAIEDRCTHDDGALDGGLVQGDEIVCPRHGARFCLRTGAALCAPAFEDTAVFPVKVEDGAVWVRDDRWD
jgi:3-phenylpropionate/trans-cinnamate dioxygenase ferredoxin subunit